MVLTNKATVLKLLFIATSARLGKLAAVKRLRRYTVLAKKQPFSKTFSLSQFNYVVVINLDVLQLNQDERRQNDAGIELAINKQTPL